jgi:succinate-semialdehyde dehydrogenase/glutarate-semialdehyde dehydrogenase
MRMYQEPSLFIGGESCGGSAEAIPVINPATEDILGYAPQASEKEVLAVLKAAHGGLEAWRRQDSWSRSAKIRRIGELMRERVSSIARHITLEVGKPLKEAEMEVLSSADYFDWAADESRRIFGTGLDSRIPDCRIAVRYEPVGITLALTAWNFPVNLASRKLSLALAAGCSTILRPANEAPASAALLVQCCLDAGLPAGTVNLLLGDPDRVVGPLMSEPAIRKVSFTGSTRVGKLIIQQSAQTVKRLTLELGGHAPVLVLEDADVEQAALISGQAKFRNAGQVCTCPSRFFVHKAKVEEFTDRLAALANSIRIGNGLAEDITMGPLASARQRDHAEELVEDARGKGAAVLHGGRRPPEINRGFFFEPTVLNEVPDTARILYEEPFAPIAAVVPVSSTEEAITRSNELSFGLAGYVFTRSHAAAARVSEQLEVGVVGLNTCTVAIAEAPFGGVKESGYGREGGIDSIKDFLSTKSVLSKLSS